MRERERMREKERGRERESVCVCVREREREEEREKEGADRGIERVGGERNRQTDIECAKIEIMGERGIQIDRVKERCT